MTGPDSIAMLRNRLSALLSLVRFGQFLSVGVVGAVLDTTVTLSLSNLLGVNPDLAKFVGAEAAIVLMFLVNDRWTFAAAGASGIVARLRRLVTSNVVRVGGLSVQLVTYHFVRQLPVTIPLAGFELYSVVAIGIAIGAGFVVNYVAESLFTWRVRSR
ncbi:MAG: GtrA family protein [Halanaeroarchaeum sp.]